MTDSGTRRPSLLVLDDERDMCEYVADAAAERDLVAVWCDDAGDFPSRFAIDIQVIFLDLVMPGMDGIEIIRFLADNKCQAKLVLMTGYDSHVLESARRLAESRGLKVAGVLRKPFPLTELNRIFDELAVGERPQAVRSAQAAGRRPPPVDAGDIRRAVDAGEIVPFFQPKVAVATRGIIGAEVLARWFHPEHGMIPPDAFIPLAEAAGLIEAVTETIIGQALDQAQVWARAGRQVALALNVSPYTLRNLDFPDLMLARASERGLEPRHITLEITETALPDDLSAALDILTRLRMRRFGLSIDDFGTGYSSMKQLQDAPFTELKIDRSFVDRALVDVHSRAIVESSIALGHRLDMKVVAEGVETEDQFDLLHALGCEEAQGYLFGRPVAPADLPD